MRMRVYLIAAVLRQDGCEDQSMERLIEIRVTAPSVLAARRLFLERIWSKGLLCSYVAGVTCLSDQEV